MIYYNVPFWGLRQPAWHAAVADAVATSDRHRQPISARRNLGGVALGASVMLHAIIAGGLLLWLRKLPLSSQPAETAVAMVYQPPGETAQPPLAPPVEAAPASAASVPEVPLPPGPPADASLPAPPSPPVQQALTAPPAPPPALTTLAPRTVEVPQAAPPRPPPASPRPQVHPAVRPPLPKPASAPPSASPSPPALASTPSVPAPPSASTISADWRLALSAWLAAHKTYPEAARQRGQQGAVQLRFTVERSGRVIDVAVAHGSGSAILDSAAAAMLNNATLPAFPAGMSQERVNVTVAVRFTLTD